jgi:hypothetical protein
MADKVSDEALFDAIKKVTFGRVPEAYYAACKMAQDMAQGDADSSVANDLRFIALELGRVADVLEHGSWGEDAPKPADALLSRKVARKRNRLRKALADAVAEAEAITKQTGQYMSVRDVISMAAQYAGITHEDMAQAAFAFGEVAGWRFEP